MLDNASLDGRVNLLTRLKKMLELKRERFRNYLGILEKQELAIVSGDLDALAHHTAMEQQLVRDILAVQKVIVPLDNMYHSIYPDKKEEITNLQNCLSKLKKQALTHNAQNRELLSHYRDELKKKLAALRLPKAKRSIYAASHSSTMIDIRL